VRIEETIKGMFSKDLDTFVKRESTYRQNKATLYSLIWGQCTEAMRAKLEAVDGFEDASTESDRIALLRLIQQATYEFESQRNPYLAVYTAIKQSHNLFQRHSTPCDTYLENMQNQLHVVEHCGGRVGNHSALLELALKEMGIIDASQATPAQTLLTSQNQETSMER